MAKKILERKAQAAADPKHRGKLRVAAYCRVRSDSGDPLNSLEAQRAYYTRKIEENPDWEMAGIYADEVPSGADLKKRKEFNRMIAACKRGRIDMILVKSISRFARNAMDCVRVVQDLKAIGVSVIFEKENFNTLAENSDAFITLFCHFSQEECKFLTKNFIYPAKGYLGLK